MCFQRTGTVCMQSTNSKHQISVNIQTRFKKCTYDTDHHNVILFRSTRVFLTGFEIIRDSVHDPRVRRGSAVGWGVRRGEGRLGRRTFLNQLVFPELPAVNRGSFRFQCNQQLIRVHRRYNTGLKYKKFRIKFGTQMKCKLLKRVFCNR